MVSYQGGQFWGVTDESLARLGEKRQVILSIQNFLIVPELLMQNEWLAVVPKRLVDSLKHLVWKNPPIDITRFSKVLIWHERTHRDSAFQWIREVFAQAVV